MIIGVISDIHSNLEALKSVLDELEGIDLILCIGDIVGYGPRPNECIDITKEKCKYVIQGNHDFCTMNLETISWFNAEAAKAIQWTQKTLTLESKTYLSELKPNLDFKIDDIKINLFHGSPDSPLYQYIYLNSQSKEKIDVWLKSCDILILGHTHVPFIYKTEIGLAINPGAVGQPRDSNPNASYAIIDTEKMSAKIKRVEYNIDSTAHEILKEKLPKFLATRLYLGI